MTSVQLAATGDGVHEIRIAEFPLGRIRIIEVPRPAVLTTREIPEASVPGVLCLIRAVPGARPSVRILDCESLCEQLCAELCASPAWTRAALISLRFAVLKPGQAALLAYRLKQLVAGNALRSDCSLEESVGPPPRADDISSSECHTFLEEITPLTEALGLNLFTAERPSREFSPREESLYYCEARGAYARGRLHAEGFLVLKGSRGHLASSRSTVTALQEDLEKRGILRREGQSICFEDDHVFANAALAASAVLGTSSTGFFEWKHSEGLTLGEALRSELAGLT